MKFLWLILIALTLAGGAALLPAKYQGAAIVGVILLINGRLLWNLWSHNR